MVNRYKSVRLYIKDFIDENVYEFAVSILNINKFENNGYYLYLWHSDSDNLVDNDIEKLKEKIKSDMPLLEVRIYNISKYEYPCWFDIVNISNTHLLDKYKFRTMYKNNNELILGMQKFRNTLNESININNKPHKIQYVARK